MKTFLKFKFLVVMLLRLYCGSLACYILQQYYNWNSFNHAFRAFGKLSEKTLLPKKKTSLVFCCLDYVLFMHG